MIGNNVSTPKMLNPTAWDLGGKSCFLFAGTSLLCLAWCYIRLPETKELSYLELDILFERRAPAAKFRQVQTRLANSAYLSLSQAERLTNTWHGCYFWFEAFDEPWNISFNEKGKEWEDKWGLLDVNRKLKDGVKIPSCNGQTVSKYGMKIFDSVARLYDNEQRDKESSWRDHKASYKAQQNLSTSTQDHTGKQIGDALRRATGQMDHRDYSQTSPDVEDGSIAANGRPYGPEHRQESILQLDPKKRKRNSNNRTRTGCLTCRKRKKKCDEQKPECKSTTDDGSAPHIDEKSIECKEISQTAAEWSGAIASAWSWKAKLINVKHGVHRVTVSNATTQDGRSRTESTDRFLFRVGAKNNPIVFPQMANHSTTQTSQ
ncbi:hypothetical protein O9K51_10965 [Purpureocillium lavendulum]|uniref:Mok11-13/Ags1-like Ig-like beta-sandwich domain-containing protein n=1 Tax=Purpureocillium lavendulum TaxID=1247861 RepID=A0AB34FAW4_9HYPO|nr:hypothetical protein O9K51_10965 [Purpureocillium lavendulum]